MPQPRRGSGLAYREGFRWLRRARETRLSSSACHRSLQRLLSGAGTSLPGPAALPLAVLRDAVRDSRARRVATDVSARAAAARVRAVQQFGPGGRRPLGAAAAGRRVLPTGDVA